MRANPRCPVCGTTDHAPIGSGMGTVPSFVCRGPVGVPPSGTALFEAIQRPVGVLEAVLVVPRQSGKASCG